MDEMGRRGIEGIRFRVLEGRLWMVSLKSGSGLRRGNLGCVDALSQQTVVDAVDNKAGNMVLEQSSTLAEQMLDALCMAAGRESLSVPVFLVAKGAGCRARGAARVLGIALQDVSGSCRRARPAELALIFLLLHLAQASWERRRRRVPGDATGASSWLSCALRLRFGCGWELSCVGGGSMRRARAREGGADTRLCKLPLVWGSTPATVRPLAILPHSYPSTLLYFQFHERFLRQGLMLIRACVACP
jgi:hypothetical protein